MFVPIAMIIMIFGMTSVINYAQETPPKAMSEEEIMQLPEFQELMKSQTTIDNFTGDENSEEFKALIDDMQKKQSAFESIISQNQPSGEGAPQETATDTPADQPTQEPKAPQVETKETPSETPNRTQTESAPVEQDTSPKEDTPSSDKTTDNTPEGAVPAPKIDESTKEITPKEEPSVSEEETPIAPGLEEQEALIPEEPISEEPVGIDTVSLENPQGNWLFKRIWWERAEERYERIRILVDGIWESRNTFFKERNQLDRNILDPFYMSIGIDRGELQIILSEINDFLEQQREQQGDLTEQERVLYETYATEEETLKQLKLDVDMITSLDQAIDDALGTFMNQINRVKSYEAEAWKNFKEIAHILNDTRARELYYMIEGAARNIKTISIYLEQEFFTHFNKLVDEAKTRVARVQSQMDALKEKGVLFQRQAEQLEQQQTTAEDQEDEDDEEETKPKPQLGWIDWMVEGVSDVFGYIWSIIRMPYDMIFGK